jgi:hypothetical protein
MFAPDHKTGPPRKRRTPAIATNATRCQPARVAFGVASLKHEEAATPCQAWRLMNRNVDRHAWQTVIASMAILTPKSSGFSRRISHNAKYFRRGSSPGAHPMSNTALTWAWTAAVSATCKLVLVNLADRADDDSKCWPSLARIATDTGLTERSARAALTALERASLLRREYRSKQSTRYCLAMGERGSPIKATMGEPHSPEGGTTFPHQGHNGGTTFPLMGEPRSPRTLREEPSLEEEPSLNHHKHRARVVDDAAFAEWWDAYPKAKRVAKDAARKAYGAALARATPAEMLLGLRRARWSDESRFIPHPATWLNQGRWDDDPEAVPPSSRPASKLSALGDWIAGMDAEERTGLSKWMDPQQPADTGPIIDGERGYAIERAE